MPAFHPTRADLAGSRPVWLLTLMWNGHVYRLSTEPVTVLTAGGERLFYSGGMSNIEAEERIAASGIEGKSIPIRAVLDVDLVALVVRGVWLGTATGYLDMVTTRDGKTSVQTWEARYRYLRGRVMSPQLAPRGAPVGLVSFSLEQGVTLDRGRIIPPRAVISTEVWPTHGESYLGKPYPLVIGRVGWYQIEGTNYTTSGSPGYVVETTTIGIPAVTYADTILFTLGHAVASTAILYYDSNKVTVNLTNTRDALGTPICVADVSGESNAVRTASAYWFAINSGAAARLPYAESDHRGAGDWLRWLWSISTVDVDHGAWAAIAPVLNSIKLATYINDPDVSPAEWILSNVLGRLPVEMVSGPDGAVPILDEIDAPVSAARHILEGPDFLYVGPLEEEPIDDIVESYTLRYAPRGKTGDMLRQLTIAADPTAGDPLQDRSLSAVNASQLRGLALPNGPAGGLVEDSKILYDLTSASRSARYRARRKATVGHIATFSADVSMGDLSIGQRIALTSTFLGVTSLVGDIRAKRWASPRWVYQVRFAYGLAGPPR